MVELGAEKLLDMGIGDDRDEEINARPSRFARIRAAIRFLFFSFFGWQGVGVSLHEFKDLSHFFLGFGGHFKWSIKGCRSLASVLSGVARSEYPQTRKYPIQRRSFMRGPPDMRRCYRQRKV